MENDREFNYTITSNSDDGEEIRLLSIGKTNDGDDLFIFHIPADKVRSARDPSVAKKIAHVLACEMQSFTEGTARH